VAIVDNANPHLLSTSGSHPPSPGIEQVFEVDAGSWLGVSEPTMIKAFQRRRLKIAEEVRAPSKSLIHNMLFNLHDLEDAQDALQQEISGTSPEVIL
jgi:hypothetical protein